MTRIEEVSVYLPKNRMDLNALLMNKAITGSNLVALRRNGIESIPLEANDTSLIMLFRTLDQLFIKSKLLQERVRLIIMTFAQLSFPNHIDIYGICKERYNLVDSIGFSVVDVACSSFLMGLKVCNDWMNRPSVKNDEVGIVVSIEKSVLPSQRMGSDYFVIGDAGAAAMLSKGEDAQGDEILAICNTMDTKAVTLGLDKLNRTGVGRYTHLINLYKCFIETLSKVGVTIDDIELIIPNNVILETWHALGHLLNVDIKKFFLDGMKISGHAVNCDLLINYSLVVERKLLRKGDLYMFTSIGEGGGVGCALCRKG